VLLPDFGPRPRSFIVAKWLARAATAATPILFVVVLFKHDRRLLDLAFGTMLFVPIMGAAGYWTCLIARQVFIEQAERRQDFFPSHWPFPFSVFNVIHRLSHHPRAAALNLALINGFVVMWCGFLLLWVLLGIILVSFPHLVTPSAAE
jgi:hypothetical protein